MDVSNIEVDATASRESERPTESEASSAKARRAAPDAWDREARQLVKAAMKRRDFSYKSLARTLEAQGGEPMAAEALALRINRGAFSFGFALRVLRAMDVRMLDISDVTKRLRGD